MKSRTCYVISFYLGDRRSDIDRFKTDKLCYLKGHIETLEKYKHSLSKIIFNFNADESHFNLLSEAINIIPKRIQQSEIEINIRPNYGLSYGAWSDMFLKHKDEYEYYLFNEDDYFFIQDNFDDYLINKFNSLPNCGYLCGLVRRSHTVHGGMSSGISSYDCLNKLVHKFGELPHSKDDNYKNAEDQGQIGQTNELFKLGYDIYDIRDDYRLRSWQGGKVFNFFMWNNVDLFIPAKIYFNEPYVWTDIIDTEFLKMSTLNDSNVYYDYYGDKK